jgi:acetyl esterase
MSRRLSLVALSLLTVILTLAVPSEAQSRFRVRRDIRYGTAGGVDLLLDAYVPRGGGPHPAVVVIPGGRWVNVDKAGKPHVSEYLAEQGFVAFAVGYRSALDAPYPAAIDDVRQAVAWIRAHARDFGVDPRQIAALGWSAGGHLAGLLGTLGRGPLDRGTRIRAVVSWSGPMNLVPLLNETNAEPDPSVPSKVPTQNVRDVVVTFLDCTGDRACEEAARRASPLVHLDPTDAPMYLANSVDEVIPVGQARQMAAALGDAGVMFQYKELPGWHHGAGYGANTKMMNEAIAFIRGAFGEQAAGEESEQTSGSPAPTKDPARVVESPESASAKPVASSESSPRSLPGWAVFLALLALAALMVSTIQLVVAMRALRLARQTRGESPAASRELARAGYGPRSTEDTHPDS